MGPAFGCAAAGASEEGGESVPLCVVGGVALLGACEGALCEDEEWGVIGLVVIASWFARLLSSDIVATRSRYQRLPYHCPQKACPQRNGGYQLRESVMEK